MSAPTSKRAAGGVMMITVTLLSWSSVPLFLRYFTSFIDAWTTNGWRYGVSALFWLPVLVVSARRGRLPKGLWLAAVVPSAFNILAQICYAWAPYFIKPGLLVFMLRLQIVFVAFGAYLLFPIERPVIRSPAYLCGVVIVLVGLLGLCFLGEEIPRGATAFGIILGIVAGVLYSGYSLSVRHFMRAIHPVYAFAAISLYTASALLVIMLCAADGRGAAAWAMSWGRLGLLIASAMIGIALSHVLYYSALGRIGVSLSAGVMLLQPFLTSSASYFLFGERLTPAQWLSGALAVGGALIMLNAQRLLAGPKPATAAALRETGSTEKVGRCADPAAVET